MRGILQRDLIITDSDLIYNKRFGMSVSKTKLDAFRDVLEELEKHGIDESSYLFQVKEYREYCGGEGHTRIRMAAYPIEYVRGELQDGQSMGTCDLFTCV